MAVRSGAADFGWRMRDSGGDEALPPVWRGRFACHPGLPPPPDAAVYLCRLREYCHPEGNVMVMTEFNGSLYVAGVFRKAGENSSWNIARWDP